MNTDIDRLYVLLMDIKRELRELREALPKPALVNIPKEATQARSFTLGGGHAHATQSTS